MNQNAISGNVAQTQNKLSIPFVYPISDIQCYIGCLKRFVSPVVKKHLMVMSVYDRMLKSAMFFWSWHSFTVDQIIKTRIPFNSLIWLRISIVGKTRAFPSDCRTCVFTIGNVRYYMIYSYYYN